MKTFTIALYSILSLLGFLEIWDAFIDFLSNLGLYLVFIPAGIVCLLVMKKRKKESLLKKRYGKPSFAKH